MREVFLVGHLVVDTVKASDQAPRIALGGTVAYGSIAAVNHGFTPHVVSTIGRDFPEEFLATLARKGVVLDFLTHGCERSTSFTLEYTPQGRLLRLSSRCSPITVDNLPLERLEGKPVVVGPVAGEVPESSVREIVLRAAVHSLDIQGYIRVFEDGHVRLANTPEALRVLKYGGVVHAEVREAMVIAGNVDPRTAALLLLKKGAEISLVTDGENGSWVGVGNRVLRVPALRPPGKVVDTTGAGDVFTTVFTLEYFLTGEVEWAAAMASAAAAHLVTGPGFVGMVPRENLLEGAEEILEKIVEI